MHHYIRGARATEWSAFYKGDFAGFKPNGKGQCSLSDVGSFEQCEMQAGQRIDLAYKDRTAAEARRPRKFMLKLGGKMLKRIDKQLRLSVMQKPHGAQRPVG